MKKTISYLFWTILTLIILYAGAEIQSYIKKTSEMTYELLPYIIFTFLFPILIGGLIGLTKFISATPKKKRWAINWAKLILIALPFLYIALIPILFFYNLPSLSDSLSTRIVNYDLPIPSLASIIVGYIIVDSLKE